MRVKHPQFGEGTVLEQNATESKVDFDLHGVMTVNTSSIAQLNFVFG